MREEDAQCSSGYISKRRLEKKINLRNWRGEGGERRVQISWAKRASFGNHSPLKLETLRLTTITSLCSLRLAGRGNCPIFSQAAGRGTPVLIRKMGPVTNGAVNYS